MRIAQLAPLIEAVPPAGYGGIELVVSNLTEQLVERGHDVTLFASGDSQTSAKLVPIVERSLRQCSHIKPHMWPAFDCRGLLLLESMQDQFDIVHNHMGWQAIPTVAKFRVPAVSTNHNNIERETRAIYLANRHQPYVGISHAYKRQNLGDELNYVDVIYNGINLERFEYDRFSERAYLLFIGRLCHDKGTAEAIKLALRLNLPLKLAGKVDTTDVEYFKTEIEPLLGNPLLEYVGEVNEQQKVNLLRGAIALTYPISFEEPFGLVMVESLACGVPVLAFDRGSVREILQDKETAIIDNSVEELASRFPEIATISRQYCREQVQSRFGAALMADRYEAMYERLLYKAFDPEHQSLSSLHI
jgi:glycosyltransferase involved in cell wall biosynthesis